MEIKTNYTIIKGKLINILAKKHMSAEKEQQDTIKDANLADEYENIIESTINKYNYKGKNFNPAYLPIIIAMALKKQEFKIIQNASLNKQVKPKPKLGPLRFHPNELQVNMRLANNE